MNFLLRSSRPSWPLRACFLSSGASERRDLSTAARKANQRRPDDGRRGHHAAWQTNFERLAQYVKEQQQQSNTASASNTSSSVSAPYPRDDPILRAWLDKQRHSLRQKKRKAVLRDQLTGDASLELPTEIQDRIQQLETLGYSLSTREDKWESKFQQLKDFVKVKGCFPYECPSEDLTTPEHRSLLWWCRLQRKSYRRFAHGDGQDQRADDERTDGMNSDDASDYASQHALRTKERMAKLESIGFRFDPFEETWNLRYQELTAYYRHHGNCRVPSDYPANPRLAVWVGEQRYHYKKFREERPSSMTDHRIELLKKLGFEWNVFDAKWNDKYERLREHVRVNGTGWVVSSTRHDRELQNWIKQQLKLYRAKSRGESNSLTDEREARLKEMDFPWKSGEALLDQR